MYCERDDTSLVATSHEEHSSNESIPQVPSNKRIIYNYVRTKRKKPCCLIYRYQIHNALVEKARMIIPTQFKRGKFRQTDIRIGHGVIDAIHGLIYSSPCSSRYANRLMDIIIELWSYKPTTIRVDHVYEAERIIKHMITD